MSRVKPHLGRGGGGGMWGWEHMVKFGYCILAHHCTELNHKNMLYVRDDASRLYHKIIFLFSGVEWPTSPTQRYLIVQIPEVDSSAALLRIRSWRGCNEFNGKRVWCSHQSFNTAWVLPDCFPCDHYIKRTPLKICCSTIDCKQILKLSESVSMHNWRKLPWAEELTRTRELRQRQSNEHKRCFFPNKLCTWQPHVC